MPSQSMVNKALKCGPVSEVLDRLGFKPAPKGGWFYRERADLVDFVDFWVKSSQEWMEVMLDCWPIGLLESKGYESLPISLKHIPGSITGRRLGEDEIDSSSAWRIEPADRLEESMSRIADRLRGADSWFLDMKGTKDVYAELDPVLVDGRIGQWFRDQ